MTGTAKPYKVLNVSQNHRIVSGADRFFFLLTQILEERGHDVVTFAASHPEDEPSRFEAYFPKSPDHDSPGLTDIARHIYSPSARANITKLIADEAPDVAHLHNYYGKLTASILTPLERAGIPTVQTLHDYKLVCPVYTLNSNGEPCEACNGKSFWHATAKRCNQRSLARSLLSTVESYVSRQLGDIEKIDRFIAVSGHVKERVSKLGVPADKITVIHNYIHTDEITPVSGDGQSVLYIGRMERMKGIFTLLDAVAPMTDLEVGFVGTGNDLAELEDQINARGLRHVTVHGFKSGAELEALYQSAMFTIVPSEWPEPFGTVILEALAHGLPVVGTDLGGTLEALTDGVEGLIVPPGDVERLRAAIEQLAQDRAKRDSMGSKARQRAEAQFSPNAHYNKLIDVYRAAVVGA